MIVGALAGVRVVELTEGVAGPLATRLLGDAGADVIKIELRDGDRVRGWVPQVDGVSVVFSTLNRNKRSIAVDAASLVVIAELAQLADIMIVDQRLVDQLSLDLPGIMAMNRALVVCVISGWGPEGPWADRAGGELPAQLAAEATSSLGRPGEEPVRLGTEHAGIACALYAFQAVTAALLVADDGGQLIDVSLFGSLMHMRAALWVALSNPDEWWGFHLDSYTKPPEHYYTCKDRRALIQAQSVRDMAALAKDLEMDFVFDDPRWPQWSTDSGPLGRHGALVHDLWDRGLSQWTFEEANAIFIRHGGAMVPCFTYEEFLADPQVQHLGVVVDTADGPGSGSRDFRPPWQMSATPASLRLPAPQLDQHGAEIRAEIVAPRHWNPIDG